MKLLIDMNLSPLWVDFFARSGFDSVHWSQIGKASAADSEIMDYASANGLTIFTHDLDFGALLAYRKTSQPSVIQIRAQEILPSDIGEKMLRALRTTIVDLEAGALVTVDSGRNRIRMLPI